MHERRKQDHLRIALREEVRSGITTGLEQYHLIHQALPEMALGDVRTELVFLGHTLRAPLLISAMTGGTPEARRINAHLAAAAQALGLAMGLGSVRAAIEDASLWPTYQVRHIAPDILLFSNLGAVQLNYGYGLAECQRAVEAVGADALVLHLNTLQEALQPEGNHDFRRLLGKIEALCRALPFPVIVKEVGAGISGALVRRLRDAGVAAVDVAGAGGTSWSQVESYRAASPEAAEVARAFARWGIPTAECLRQARLAAPGLPLIASGGIQDGIDVAVCLALGARLCGIARPLLAAATASAEAVTARLNIVFQQLRVAMFCAGAARLEDLTPNLLQEQTREP